MLFNSALFMLLSVLAVESAYDRTEGEICQTDEAVGKCVHIHKCLSSMMDLQKKNKPAICSFRNNDPIVCCPDCEVVNDTRNALIDNDGGVFFRSGQSSRDKCLEHLTNLPFPCQTSGLERVWNPRRQCYSYETTFHTSVVGGHDALRSSYPHMTLLGYGDDEDSAQWLCGGSLISERFILTAAHCLSESAVGPVRFVAMGILRRSDPGELWHIRNVKRAIKHPEYNPPSKYHDIALLETATPVVFNKDVFPACLDYKGEEWSVAFATGWGKLGKHRPLADSLQEVSLRKFSTEECQKNFPPHRLLKAGYDANMQMCYGDTYEPKDTCEGDSGGPIQVKSRLSKCLHTIIGVTSFGRACGYAGNAGMYTRIYHYLPWIESIVWPGWVSVIKWL